MAKTPEKEMGEHYEDREKRRKPVGEQEDANDRLMEDKKREKEKQDKKEK